MLRSIFDSICFAIAAMSIVLFTLITGAVLLSTAIMFALALN